jgi:hypothetical protein
MCESASPSTHYFVFYFYFFIRIMATLLSILIQTIIYIYIYIYITIPMYILHFIFIFFHSLNMPLGPALLKKGVYSIHIEFLPCSVAVFHLHGFPKVSTLLHVGIHAIVSPLGLGVHIVYISKRSL